MEIVWSIKILCKARYSMAGKNLAMCGYLSVYILLLLSTRLIMYSEKVITYFDNIK